MTPPKPAVAVYYRREDYASFWRRAIVDLIDVAVASVLALVLVIVLPFLPTVLVMAVTAFGYFVVLKRSKWRTVGYRAGGVRIVGLNGNTPSWASLCYRTAFLLLGPLNCAVDLIWLSSDTHRQAIRDKLAHTYVIRSAAEPAGAGTVTYRYYEICGYNFLFQEVEVPPQAAHA